MMPAFDQPVDSPKKGRIVKSEYDSESFESDGSIHVEGVVGSATISPSGRDIALASPEGLAIIDLDSPYSPPRRLRGSGQPWLVVDVQWSPFTARDYWVVSTANHRALVWNLNLRDDSNTGAIEHSLQGHTRAITDVNFSAHHPDLLATCSVDGYVHWWDLRRPRQPVLTFCDFFAGATQVKYNRRNPHILASSHDRWLRIWDERKVSEPVKSITAHTSKIYGLDWNRSEETSIVTCSLDQSIKFWDYSKDDNELEHVIHTEYPVWRARHTPFGYGLLAMPQNEPGDLYLYDRLWSKDESMEATRTPVALFPGHGDHQAKEFLWRTRGGVTDDGIDEREFQLVSWGTDNELRLHCIDPSIFTAVGYKRGSTALGGISTTRKGATYKTFRAVDDASTIDKRASTMKDSKTSTGGLGHKQSALTAAARSSVPFGRQMRPSWRGPSMKAKNTLGKRLDPSQAQIGWMKGISITKRKGLMDGPRRLMSKDSGIMGHGYPDDQWGEPDTIQEELLRVSTQIPKVKWDNIDMDNLTLSASLNGPWGKDGENIFIKVKIDIPTEYPKLKAPKFTIERSSFMQEEMHKRLDRELHELADQFLRRKQNCLEVIFTYLLGEVDLESSTTFFKNVRDLDDDLDGLADDSSTDEEEDIPAGGSASMSQELPPADADTAIAIPARTIVPPPPLTCGARFSHDGRLVCFFPTKEEKARALFQTSADANKDRPRLDQPFFAGFGRLTHDPPPRYKYTTEEASATDDQSDSDESGESSSSSSDSESTSINKMSLWYHSSRHLRKAWSEDRSIRSSGGGTGTGIGTGTGTGTSRRRIGRPRNAISIHDLRPDLPSKREFAQEYAIFGDGADVCEHNARVAEKYGYPDLMSVWQYLALLLKKGIPLEVLASNQRRASILVIARDTVSKTRSIDDEQGITPAGDSALLGRVKWGRHPLAKDFIQELFNYFEKIADVQMLAMLSCIFSESSTDDSVAYVESQLPSQETPLPLKAPSFSLDYFPTDATMWNIYGRGIPHSNVTTPGTLHTPLPYAGSHASDDGMTWTGEPGTNSYSCGETPPPKARPLTADADPPPTMLSRSPSNRPLSRVSTGLSSAFSTNFPRSFTGASSSSPPAGQLRKKPSPAEMILNTLTPRTGYASAGPSYPVGDSSGGRNSVSDDEYRRDDTLSLVPVSVSVFVEDQTMFDDDGWLSEPLLEPSRANIYANYRYAYAEMLQMWRQPLARLEVMKFNVLKDESPFTGAEGSFHDSFTLPDGASGNTNHLKTGSSPIIMGKKDQLQILAASGRNLDVTGICRVHETQLDPLRYTSTDSKVGGAVGNCDRCRRIQSQLRCVYCLEPVDALFPPCLTCGCASHEDCLAEWHAAGEMFCPAGDECNCVEQASSGQVESWAALRGAVMKSQSQSKLSMLPGPALGDHDEGYKYERKTNMNNNGDDANGDWERVGKNVPSRAQGAAATPGLSFVRFKTPTGAWSRASSQRRNGKRGN
ncbi:uncharacterized protein TrAFT101_010261 [Trichoderma asperellum]|uniref:uncharacterized protein n=1 Tax=Trichoderma asperellum TaxID=101201 RepID=UPI00331E0285|nr:hypothetical protein TrAFT101_010261 [Trichoderma asperellum]